MTAAEPPLVAVYADESCRGNGRTGDNPGGGAALIEYVDQRTGTMRRRDLWLSEPATTNNRMALRSAIEVFRALRARKGSVFRVRFTSDSEYLVKGAKEWIHGWAARGWRKKAGEVANLQLWQELCDASEPHECEWRWVRGHGGHPQNSYADHLATRAADDQANSGGLVRSAFAEWLIEERARGQVTVAPDPFPVEAEFRASRKLPSTPSGRLMG
ncbi:MAG: ribonuclease H family protein [Gemmatimonadaceae bacterium]